MLVGAGELGNDYEHCLALHRKLDDVDSEARVDEERFNTINRYPRRSQCCLVSVQEIKS